MVNGDFYRHIMLVLVGYLGLLGVPMPLPVPPMAEDGRLLQVAPAETALFVQWFGQASGVVPSLDSKNRTERLAAEPDVRRAIARLVAGARGAIAHDGGDEQATQAVLSFFDQGVGALQRPGCVFVTDLKPLAGGLVVAHAGQEQAEVAGLAFSAAMSKALHSQDALAHREVAGVRFEAMAPDGGPEFVGWAAVEGCLVVAVGEASAKQIVAGLRGEDRGLAASAEVTRLRAQCKVERPMLRTYASLLRIRAQAPFVQTLWGPIGLDACEASMAESGLEGDGFVSRLHVESPKPRGVLAKLRAKPLSQDDLALIPGDATVAMAARTAEGSIEDVAQGIVASIAGEDLSRLWDRFLVELERTSGVQLRKDLFAHADDCAVAWSSPRQGGFGITSATAAVPLRDGRTFADNLTAMWEKMQDVAPNKDKERLAGRRIRSGRGYLGRFEHDGTDVWWIDHADRDFPFGVSWAATDKHFLLGLQPQPMRSVIDASKLPTNFDRALVRKPLVARRGEANAMLYLDLGKMLEQTYGPLMMLFQSASDEWQSDGFDFDLADVPRLESVQRHLRGELAVLKVTDKGCSITRRGTLPVFDPLLFGAGMACLLGLD